MTKIKETDIAKNLVSDLRNLGFETWQEVQIYNGVIDVIAKIYQFYVSFEVKTILNDTVLMQAKRNNHWVDYSYVVVPASKSKSKQISEVKSDYIKNNKLGLIEIREKYYKDEKFSTNDWYVVKPFDDIPSTWKIRRDGCMTNGKGIEEFLCDAQKDSIAGSQSGGVITRFKQSMILIRDYCKENDVKNMQEIWKNIGGQLHWRSSNSMRSAMYTLQHVDLVKEAYDAYTDSVERFKKNL